MPNVVVATLRLILCFGILLIIARCPEGHYTETPFFAQQKWNQRDAYGVLFPLMIWNWLLALPPYVSTLFLVPSYSLINMLSFWAALCGLYHFRIKRRYGTTLSVFGLGREKFVSSAVPTGNIVFALMLLGLAFAAPSGSISRCVSVATSEVVAFAIATSMGAVVSPILEELLFTGIVYAPVARRIGTVKGMACLSLLRALLHLHANPIQTFCVFSLAFVCYWAYQRSESLYAPVIVHVGGNFLSSRFRLISCLPPSVDVATIDRLLLFGLVAAMLLINAFWVTTILKRRSLTTIDSSFKSDH
jgi:membrane protease YdiL (CAAX protease family)